MANKDQFARIRARTAAVIKRFGAPVTFRAPGIPARKRDDDTWTDPVESVEFVGDATNMRGDPEEVVRVKATMVLRRPVTVIVAALGLARAPEVGMRMLWTTRWYDVKACLPIAPNGNAIYYIVIGDI